MSFLCAIRQVRGPGGNGDTNGYPNCCGRCPTVHPKFDVAGVPPCDHKSFSNTLSRSISPSVRHRGHRSFSIQRASAVHTKFDVAGVPPCDHKSFSNTLSRSISPSVRHRWHLSFLFIHAHHLFVPPWPPAHESFPFVRGPLTTDLDAVQQTLTLLSMASLSTETKRYSLYKPPFASKNYLT